MLKTRIFNPFGPVGEERYRSYGVDQRDDSIDWFSGSRESAQSGPRATYASMISASKIRFCLMGMLVLLGLLAARGFYLQIVNGNHYKSIAEGNRVRVRDIKATRGIVYDRNQKVLARNVPSFSLVVVPVDLPKDDVARRAVFDFLSARSGKTLDELRQLIDSQPAYSYQPIAIKENIAYDDAIKDRIEASAYRGVELRTANQREYLFADETPSLAHLLGYLGKINGDELERYLANGYAYDDKIGRAGLEEQYEEILKGSNGKEYVEVDALGETKKVLAYQKAEPGQDLILTIDYDLQRVSEAALRRTLEAYHKARGGVIVLDPKTGEVLALVNWPSFNSNDFEQGISQDKLDALLNDPNHPLFNRMVAGEYPPGSTFKLVVAAAALEEKIAESQTGFNSVGGIAVGGWFFPDWKAGGHGWTTITKAIAESVNTFFYIVGGGYGDFVGLGVGRIVQHAERFGLGRPLGIDLPHEGSGFLPSEEWKESTKNEPWYIGDTYHLAIGQGDVLATPLQVAVWTSVFANGGQLYQPHIGKAYVTADAVVSLQGGLLNTKFLSSSTIDMVRAGLRQTVVSGSARSLSTLPVSAAAKTGTAEWSSKYPPHAWFTAFAPFEDPQIVVTVLVEEGEEGSRVAAPVAREIIEYWAQNQNH